MYIRKQSKLVRKINNGVKAVQYACLGIIDLQTTTIFPQVLQHVPIKDIEHYELLIKGNKNRKPICTNFLHLCS